MRDIGLAWGFMFGRLLGAAALIYVCLILIFPFAILSLRRMPRKARPFRAWEGWLTMWRVAFALIKDLRLNRRIA